MGKGKLAIWLAIGKRRIGGNRKGPRGKVKNNPTTQFSTILTQLMNDLDMSSSDSSIAEIGEKATKKQMDNLAGFLGKEELQNLEPELKLADELMSELTTKSDGSVSKSAEKKRGRKTKEKPSAKVKKTIDKKAKQQKALVEKDKKKEAKKAAKKGKEAKKSGKKEISMDESEDGRDSNSESSPSSDESNSSDSSDLDDKKKGSTSGLKQKFLAWLSDQGRVHAFGQCSDCQAEQKGLDSPVHFMGGKGIVAHIVQCKDCIEGNSKIRRIEVHYFGNHTTKTENEHTFWEEADDYKVQSPAYMARIGQCSYCFAKQIKWGDEAVEKNDGFTHLLMAQCQNCVYANKTSKQTYYKFFSSWTGRGGGGGGSRGKGKRRRAHSTSDEDSEGKAKKSKKAKKSNK